jgi:hypothetical protein
MIVRDVNITFLFSKLGFKIEKDKKRSWQKNTDKLSFAFFFILQPILNSTTQSCDTNVLQLWGRRNSLLQKLRQQSSWFPLSLQG